MTNEAKTVSKQHIMHYVLSFCVARIYGKENAEKEYPKSSNGISGFVEALGETPIQVGDLALLSSVGVTKWQIGWLKEIGTFPNGDQKYLIESLDDGELCWWENVGIAFLHRRALRPEWRWTDRQWAFKDRWWNVCFKVKNAYTVLPVIPKFGDGYLVTISTRVRHGFSGEMPAKTFPDWRKVTKAMMAQFYDECVAEHDRVRAELKAQQDAQEVGNG